MELLDLHSLGFESLEDIATVVRPLDQAGHAVRRSLSGWCELISCTYRDDPLDLDRRLNVQVVNSELVHNATEQVSAALVVGGAVLSIPLAGGPRPARLSGEHDHP